MSESIVKELVKVCQAFLDVAPSNGHRCMYCEMSVYGSNDTDEHLPDCEMAKGYAVVEKANKEMVAAEADTPESLAEAIEALQRRANKAVRAAKLKGDEFHPLNMIDLGLFGLTCQAKNAARKFPKVDEEGNPIKL